MRSRSAFVVLIALACIAAGLADAAPKRRVTLVVPVKPASSLALRGPLGVAPAAQPLRLATLGGAVSPLPSLTPAAADAGQCRLACAHRYYLCLSDQDDAPGCPQAWSSCVVGCDRPSPAPGFSPAS